MKTAGENAFDRQVAVLRKLAPRMVIECIFFGKRVTAIRRDPQQKQEDGRWGAMVGQSARIMVKRSDLPAGNEIKDQQTKFQTVEPEGKIVNRVVNGVSGEGDIVQFQQGDAM